MRIIREDIASKRHVSRLAPLHRQHAGQRVHLAWKALTPILRLPWCHYALATKPNHRSFSLNFGYDFERVAAEAGDDALDVVFRTLTRNLKRAGIAADLVVVVEWAWVDSSVERARRAKAGLNRYRRLHAHGEIAWASGAYLDVHMSLTRAVGVWNGPANEHQLVMPPRPDSGWIKNYATKQSKRFKATATLNRDAKAKYEDFRAYENASRIKRATMKARVKRNKQQRQRRKEKSRVSVLAKKAAPIPPATAPAREAKPTVTTYCCAEDICTHAPNMSSEMPAPPGATTSEATCTSAHLPARSGLTCEISSTPLSRASPASGTSQSGITRTSGA